MNPFWGYPLAAAIGAAAVAGWALSIPAAVAGRLALAVLR